MNQFSLDRAWSLGINFVSREAANQAIILIGIGVIAPTLLQFLATGGVTGTFNPATSWQQNFSSAALAAGATMLLVILVSSVLQFGSYFASWRLGFGPNETLGGAIGYGLIMGVLIVVVGMVLLFLVGLIGAAAPIAAVLFAVLLVFPVVAFLYTLMAAFMAMAIILTLLIASAFGAGGLMAGTPMSGSMDGPIVIVIGFLLCLLLLWLAARMSCATSVMAERRTFSPMYGISESWRRTADDQWRIFGYLALLGLVLCVIFFVMALVIGAAMMGSMQSGAVPEPGVGTIVFGLIIGIVFAYLTVLVPAGIYRALGGEDKSEVFA